MRDSYKFLITTIITAALVIGTDFCIGKVGDKLLTKMPDFGSTAVKQNYRLNRMTSDIVLIGSSRCSHHYVTSILQDSVNKFTCDSISIYNAGIDGQYTNGNLCVIESILTRYSPKLIIFEMSELSQKQTIDDLYRVRPYYTTNKDVQKYYDNTTWKEKLSIKSNAYRYNRHIIPLLKTLFLPRNITTDGYEPLFNTMSTKKQERLNLREQELFDNTEIFDYTLSNFTRVLDKCKQQNVPIIILTSPMYQTTHPQISLLQSICEDRSIPYFSWLNDLYFDEHPELFQDQTHLNNDGAHIYTHKVINTLRPYFISYLKNQHKQ